MGVTLFCKVNHLFSFNGQQHQPFFCNVAILSVQDMLMPQKTTYQFILHFPYYMTSTMIHPLRMHANASPWISDPSFSCRGVLYLPWPRLQSSSQSVLHNPFLALFTAFVRPVNAKHPLPDFRGLSEYGPKDVLVPSRLQQPYAGLKSEELQFLCTWRDAKDNDLTVWAAALSHDNNADGATPVTFSTQTHAPKIGFFPLRPPL